MGFEKREFFLLVVLVLLNSSATSTATRQLSANSDDLIKVFEDWALEHKRVYPTEEEKERRFENFRATHEFVEKFYEEGGASKLYTVGLNAFADMTNEEFYDAHACFVDPADDVVSSSATTSSSSSTKVYYENKVYENKEEELCGGVTDWAAMGMISAPRDQGKCGACWAFATVAAVEAVNRQTFGPKCVVPLSVQQLITCVDSKSDGCEGGKPEAAFAYIDSYGGLCSEENYPYAAIKGSCEAYLYPNADHSSIGGYIRVQPRTEIALHNALCDQPVFAAVRANSSNFRTYTGGVFEGECGPKLDHAVLVVGTFDDIDVRYFKILNSWGENWGEKGYMRIIRDDIPGGKCGIALRASYPVVSNPYGMKSPPVFDTCLLT